jgi:3-isopropylmalate/(R)-2-methylmalate dehydratase large subunit
MPQTLFEKLWESHTVEELDDGLSLIYIDRILLHERTGSIALQSLHEEGRQVRAPERTFCTMDHIVDTFAGRDDNTLMPSGGEFIRATRLQTERAGITLYDMDNPLQGIVHVISPEQGIVQPGYTLVCPDSHTCTQGALGALAWGVGSSEVEHALVTQTLRVRRPQTMLVRFEGELQPGVTAKDMILHLIQVHGCSGGAGYAVEFAGSAVRALEVEARMTLCNMAVEFSAFTGLIAPDQKVFDYLLNRPPGPSGGPGKNRPPGPSGGAGHGPPEGHAEQALAYWRGLYSDRDAEFDWEIVLNVEEIEPTITWGTSPEHAMGISESIPQPVDSGMEKALAYQALSSGQRAQDIYIDAAFIGSCTNSRLSDLRAAAELLNGHKVADGVAAVVVPGSTAVKRAAEAEGLDKIFIQAGFEWRESGCSMCFYAGGETFGKEKRVISSTNRNFEGRQGPGTRTHLASPITVAASAIKGRITDPRELL